MSKSVPIEEFRSSPGPVLDVRSPAEFDKGRVPGAHNFPVFSDEERKRIGICYKHEGREAAVSLGLEIVGPRLKEMVDHAVSLAPEKRVRVHCWRGGMRSKSVGWLLETAGFEVAVLEEGYKAYRRWVRSVFARDWKVQILGGLTGTGKTNILNALRDEGEQILDLEDLANHRGSAFGGLEMEPQPPTQHFENLIAEEMNQLDPARRVWIESESRRIGACWVPEELYQLMKNGPVVMAQRPVEERLAILSEMYGGVDPELLVHSTKRISKGLGGERTKRAVENIRAGDLREASRIILEYYDKRYLVDAARRPVTPIEVDVRGLDDNEAARAVVGSLDRTTQAGR